MGTDTLFGRPGFSPGGPVQALVRRSKLAATPRYGDRHHVGYTRYGDRHDVRRTDRERSTSNVQLSTFNGVTERAHGGLDMGTDTLFGRPGFCAVGAPPPPVGWSRLVAYPIWGQTRCRGYPIWGQARCPAYRSGTFNVQRSTLNFQRGDRKGGWWAGYGDRHAIWTTELLARWT